MAAVPNQRMVASCRAVVRENQFRVEVVAQRHSEEDKDERARERCPLLKRLGPRTTRLAFPDEPPEDQRTGGDQQPQNVEKYLHGNVHATRLQEAR